MTTRRQLPVFPADGRVRAVVDAVSPAVDGGRFAVKRVIGQTFDVQVHAFGDGHDALRVLLCWRAENDLAPQTVEMSPRGNDVWHASFAPPRAGRYLYTAVAWVDRFRSWHQELQRRVDVADILIAAQIGAALGDATALRAKGDDRKALKRWAAALRKKAVSAARSKPGLDVDRNADRDVDRDADNDIAADVEAVKAFALDPVIAALADRYPDRSLQTRYEPELPLVMDRERAAFSAWYELFPRSASLADERHGTLKDVEARLPYVAELGFDVLYLPPIHPIGRERRKGRNNALVAGPVDVGSPWAIGAAEGGHTDILPALGSAQDFRDLVAKASSYGIEIALDIAFQCAPDHPWVTQHPQWFRHRADGSVQYAENPPKKYQDIYPFDFETDDWRALWLALKGVFEHWIAQGVFIFRVDNPHTKAFPFWEWVITEVKRSHPNVLFLAEAFTRPKVMHRLAKLGFSQSYTYYTWRQTRTELTEYFTELAQAPGCDYFRPNAWPTTPDILTEQLHGAPRSVFVSRLLLAATLSGNYGVYGPAYELMENTPREAGSEEFKDSEKYQLRHWPQWNNPSDGSVGEAGSVTSVMATVNRARRSHAAFQPGSTMCFLDTGNDQLIAYARRSADGTDAVIAVVNLDPHNRQSGWVQIDAAWLGIDTAHAFTVKDLLTGQHFSWQVSSNFVILDPAVIPAHLLHVPGSAPRSTPSLPAPRSP